MSKYLGDLSIIRINLFKKKFTNELDYINNYLLKTKENMEEDELKICEDRILMLNKIIKLIDDNLGNLKEVKQSKSLKEELDEINNFVYKKSWNRLPMFHKENKLKEYINDNVKDKDVRCELIDKLITLLNDGKIKSNKHVVYDSSLCKITAVKCLKINDDSYKISL